MSEKKDLKKLRLWQDRYAVNKARYDGELAKMDGREALYLGRRDLKGIVERDDKRKAVHIRNICAELIEAQVDSSIPQPKVTPRREGDERLAKLIEDMIRNELDRMSFEEINDMMERTVPIQGGAGYLIEWDNTQKTHTTVGEIVVSTAHPKQIIPQDGVYSGIEDMDYIFLEVPQTKEYIRRRYGVDVSEETESDPEAKTSGDASPAEDMVTQIVAYYRNDKGGIGLYSWVNDRELENLEDYQARRLRRCTVCGTVEPSYDVMPLDVPTLDGTYPGGPLPGRTEEEKTGERPASARRGGRKFCPYCGSDNWEESSEDFEELHFPVPRSDGSFIPGDHPVTVLSGETDEMGLRIPQTELEPTRIPFYKPDRYPIILQKNVSVFGRFLGDSDIDKIADQQNTTNRVEAAVIDKLLKAGSYITLPSGCDIQENGVQKKIIRLDNLQDKNLIGTYDMEMSVSGDMAYLQQVYEEARQTIGVTDSFQGRHDATATSGKAKEFSAAQTAGRLESKRIMKDAAYAALFEAIFKFKLAYADEPRPVVSVDSRGQRNYSQFNRYDFLEQDEAGEWYWNDRFLFSCDTSAPLASNREAMWQETRMNLESGAFGNPAELDTLILFWTKMDMLHYPGAGETLAYLRERLEAQGAAMAAKTPPAMGQTAPAMGQAAPAPAQAQEGGEISPEIMAQVTGRP